MHARAPSRSSRDRCHSQESGARSVHAIRLLAVLGERPCPRLIFVSRPPLGYMAPPSRDWKKDTRRGGYATMTLAVLVGYTWISASQQLVVLSNGQIRHAAAWWGWPLIASGVFHCRFLCSRRLL